MLKSFTTGAIAALVMLATPSFGAFAQDIITVDFQRALNTSTGAEHVRTEIESLQTSMAAEIKPLEEAAIAAAGPLREELEAEAQAFQDQVSQLSLVEQTKASDLQTRQAELMEKQQSLRDIPAVQALRLERQFLINELQATIRRAEAQMQIATLEIANDIRQERGALVVMDRSQGLLFDDSIDITDTVIERLNAALPAPNMERLRIDRSTGEIVQ